MTTTGPGRADLCADLDEPAFISGDRPGHRDLFVPGGRHQVAFALHDRELGHLGEVLRIGDDGRAASSGAFSLRRGAHHDAGAVGADVQQRLVDSAHEPFPRTVGIVATPEVDTDRGRSDTHAQHHVSSHEL